MTDFVDWDLKHQNIVKTLYTDTLYNSRIRYKVNIICTNVPVSLEFELITTEVQFNVKLFGDKHCHCKDG